MFANFVRCKCVFQSSSDNNHITLLRIPVHISELCTMRLHKCLAILLLGTGLVGARQDPARKKKRVNIGEQGQTVAKVHAIPKVGNRRFTNGAAGLHGDRSRVHHGWKDADEKSGCYAKHSARESHTSTSRPKKVGNSTSPPKRRPGKDTSSPQAPRPGKDEERRELKRLELLNAVRENNPNAPRVAFTATNSPVRGVCGVCKETVFDDQRRTKGLKAGVAEIPNGGNGPADFDYWHGDENCGTGCYAEHLEREPRMGSEKIKNFGHGIIGKLFGNASGRVAQPEPRVPNAIVNQEWHESTRAPSEPRTRARRSGVRTEPSARGKDGGQARHVNMEEQTHAAEETKSTEAPTEAHRGTAEQRRADDASDGVTSTSNDGICCCIGF